MTKLYQMACWADLCKLLKSRQIRVLANHNHKLSWLYAGFCTEDRTGKVYNSTLALRSNSVLTGKSVLPECDQDFVACRQRMQFPQITGMKELL